MTVTRNRVLRCWVLAMLVLSFGGCTPTYTQADLAKEERHLDKDARSEIQYDEGLEEVGGRNAEDLDEIEDEDIRESEL
jgi:hypothetical protein